MRVGKVYLPASWYVYSAMPKLLPQELTATEACSASDRRRFSTTEIVSLHQQQYALLENLKWGAEEDRFQDAERTQAVIERQLRLFRRMAGRELRQAELVRGLLYVLHRDLGDGIEHEPEIHALLSWN